MSRPQSTALDVRHLSDWGENDVRNWLCPRCCVSWDDLRHLDFPAPDYEKSAGLFWHEPTLERWVRLHAQAEIESRPSEVWDLVAMVRLVEPTLNTAEARERVISSWVAAGVKHVFNTG